MAFVVQTDPHTDGANAYITAAFMRDYHSERGRDLSNTTTYPDSRLEAAIVAATQYLDVRFEFVGYRSDADQTTEWPRSAAYNGRGDRQVGIPRAVKQATAEYAYRALSATLLADPDRDGSGQAIKSKSETVGPISERLEYAVYTGFTMPIYPLADRLLTSQGLVSRDPGRTTGFASGDLGRG